MDFSQLMKVAARNNDHLQRKVALSTDAVSAIAHACLLPLYSWTNDENSKQNLRQSRKRNVLPFQQMQSRLTYQRGQTCHQESFNFVPVGSDCVSTSMHLQLCFQ